MDATTTTVRDDDRSGRGCPTLGDAELINKLNDLIEMKRNESLPLDIKIWRLGLYEVRRGEIGGILY